ncbi:MAG: HXXEE domain-containing protein [Pyrinomonadaceae bacterium]|nr:HXXEE domain-containing protein [Pyrinomonadaceae bacterium]
MISGHANHLPSDTSTDLWSWLFPVTYLLHLCEEYFGGEGYSAYLLRLRGIQFSPTRFLVVQTIGLVLMIVGISLARRLQFPNLLSVVLGAVVLVNGITHLLLSVAFTEYVPGLLTSILLWIPLGVVTLARFRRTMRPARYWLGVAIGVAINGIIELVTVGLRSDNIHATLSGFVG